MTLPAGSPLRDALDLLWRYTTLPDEGAVTDLGLVLGCTDLGVPAHAARLFHAGRFPRLVMSGGVSAVTRPLFPDGEAVHFARLARKAGVPDRCVTVEPLSSNTEENVVRTRELLAGTPPASATLVTRPHHQRRALLTARRHWPDVAWSTSAGCADLDRYVRLRGDAGQVVRYVVGEVDRIALYGGRGMLGDVAPPPPDVLDAARLLARHGHGGRPIP